MSDVPSRDEVQNLSLDEYFNLYVQNKPVLRKRGTYPGSYSGRYPNQAQQRRRYDRSHYFAPSYQRSQQEQQRREPRQQRNPRQQQQQQHQRQQHQQDGQHKKPLERTFIDEDILDNLREEMIRLRRQCIIEYRQLEHRLSVQRAEGVQEMRLLLDRHRFARHSLQRRIHDAERICEERQERQMQQNERGEQFSRKRKTVPADKSLEVIDSHVAAAPDYGWLPSELPPDLPHWYVPLTEDKDGPDGGGDGKFNLDDVDFGGTGISTQEVIAEIQQIEEELKMDEDINSDMLFIPNNSSLHESKPNTKEKQKSNHKNNLKKKNINI
ncbi:hypothetical protein AWZ03_014340 [Drosophila navojoa]|uniref:Uncharacterized protein n=1 Tax=Drosophila navojoa TaxID=7232 RepID=A0A484ARM6_DRONA|nr:hypothetical protein AWZ03_014340 [Drosophila navojoa]